MHDIDFVLAEFIFFFFNGQAGKVPNKEKSIGKILSVILEHVQATPRLSEDKVRQCVDTRLGGDYPPKAVAKVTQLTLCLHFLSDPFCS